MSLGSKELFHSNFLEYLWNLDSTAFLIMMKDFLKKPLLDLHDFQLRREKENFDICICHDEGRRSVYDIVIENKVKSIPYKEQLKCYEEKAERLADCRFLLLTLSKSFPDRGDKDLENWGVMGYDDLLERIKDHYLKGTIRDERHLTYIKDYCNFVENLNDLKNEVVLPDNIFGQQLFVPKDINKLKEIRLHDLYIKLRCSWFALEVKTKLEKMGMDTIVVNKFDDIRKGCVNLNINLNQGNGQIAAWICDEEMNVFECVIQGNQYRHGINQKKVTLSEEEVSKYGVKNKKYGRLNALYNRLSELQDCQAKDFLNFVGRNEDVQPNRILKFQKTEIHKTGPFCCYGDDYIYRYLSVGSVKINELITMLVDDISSIYNNCPKLY